MCDYNDFFVRRLQQLRDKKNISARKMSLDLGQNKDYINHIENKKNFPTMQNFFYICQYLNVTPEEFFSVDKNSPQELKKLTDSMEELIQEQLKILDKIVNLSEHTKGND